MDHSLLSPSKAHRWFTCAASTAMCTGIKDEVSIYAATGTLAHEIGELLLIAAFKNDDELQKITNHIKKEQNNVADAMIDEVLRYVTTAFSMAGKTQTYGIETKVDLTKVYDCGSTEMGTVDFFNITISGELQIHDLKYGRFPVNAKNNKQLLIYALGVFYMYVDKYAITGVRLVIHQPLLNTISEYVLSTADLIAFGKKLKERAKIAKNLYDYPDAITLAHYTPGDATCKFCLVKSTCDSLDRYVKNSLVNDFENVSEENAVKQIEDRTKAFYVPNADITVKLSNIALIRTWCNAIEDNALAQLLEGNDIEGWKLIYGRKKAGVWIDEENTVNYALSKRLTKFIVKKILLTPAMAKKALKNKPKTWESLVKQVSYKEAGPRMVKADVKGIPYEIDKVSWTPCEVNKVSWTPCEVNKVHTDQDKVSWTPYEVDKAPAKKEQAPVDNNYNDADDYSDLF